MEEKQHGSRAPQGLKGRRFIYTEFGTIAMLGSDYLLESIDEEYRAAYYSYLFDNAHNSEETMTGPEFVAWYLAEGQPQHQQSNNEDGNEEG